MGVDLTRLYKRRFDKSELIQKNIIWKILCKDFFQRYISKDSSVLDIGAGYCEFINHIDCLKKYAVDLNEDMPKFANDDIETFVGSSTELSFLQDDSVDTIFMSNFLEHLTNKTEVMETLLEAFRVLKPGGNIIILQPNIKYAYREYWDFFDHNIIAFSENSLSEALELAGFKIKQALPRFLPYSTKSKIPKSSFLIKLYLKLPFMWRILGKQMLALATKPCIS